MNRNWQLTSLKADEKWIRLNFLMGQDILNCWRNTAISFFNTHEREKAKFEECVLLAINTNFKFRASQRISVRSSSDPKEEKFSSLLFLVVLHCCLSGYMYILALGSDSRTSWVNDPLLGGIDPRRAFLARISLRALQFNWQKLKSDSIPVERTHIPFVIHRKCFPQVLHELRDFVLRLLMNSRIVTKSHCPPSRSTHSAPAVSAGVNGNKNDDLAIALWHPQESDAAMLILVWQ